MKKRKKPESREELLLAVLASAPERSMTPVQVQKAMFVLAQEVSAQLPTKFYAFEKYNYGPFCQALYNDLGILAAQDLVAIEQPLLSRVRIYRATDAGAAKGEACVRAWDNSLGEYVKAVSEWVTSLSFPDLVRAIYRKYPAYKVNSIFSG